MNCSISRAIAGTVIMTFGLLWGTAALADRDDDGSDDDRSNDRPEACFRTTQKMFRACRADVVDDFYQQSAKCLNSDEGRSCRREARQELRDAREECGEQAESRDSLCERLPDAGPYITEVDPAYFDPDDDAFACPDGNQFYPLVVGTVTTFVNETAGEEEIIVVEVTDETREIQGVETIVVRDTVYEVDEDSLGNGPDAWEPGERIEDTDDYYAVASNCDVWYFGEVSQNFEDGYLENLDGSFIAGVEGAQAGIIMKGNPQVGDVYRQEFALGDAEDAAEVLSRNAEIEIEGHPEFNCGFGGEECLMTEDFIANEPDGTEFKYFKPNTGFVAEQLPGGEIVLRLIKVETLP